jgi:Leucine-rich repeat (LRR) protein
MSLLAELLRLVESQPNATSLSLAGKGLTTPQFEELFVLIKGLPRLQELDISRNNISSIDRISELRVLQVINITQNPLDPVLALTSLKVRQA